MKLKKIASLALAGIMAVSMLAGCKDNTNDNGDQGDNVVVTSGDFTSTVLAKTSEAARDKLTVNDDSNLDDAVNYVAHNNLFKNYTNTLNNALNNNGVKEDALVYLPVADYDTSWAPSTWIFNNLNKDTVFAGMYVVSRERSDEWIANTLADAALDCASTMTADDCNYSVRIVKADCNYNGSVDETQNAVLIGLLAEADYTNDNYQ